VLFGLCNQEGAMDCACGHYGGDQKCMQKISWKMSSWKSEQEMEEKKIRIGQGK
jgi:hypothetical protein